MTSGPLPIRVAPRIGGADSAALDQVRLCGGKRELGGTGLHLAAAEAHRVDALVDAGDDLARITCAGQHERVGHPGDRQVRIRLPPRIAGARGTHQPGIVLVLHVADQDPVFNECGALPGRALVVDVERAASIGKRCVVDHGAQFGCHHLADAAGEGRRALAVGVAL